MREEIHQLVNEAIMRNRKGQSVDDQEKRLLEMFTNAAQYGLREGTLKPGVKVLMRYHQAGKGFIKEEDAYEL